MPSRHCRLRFPFPLVAGIEVSIDLTLIASVEIFLRAPTLIARVEVSVDLTLVASIKIFLAPTLVARVEISVDLTLVARVEVLLRPTPLVTRVEVSIDLTLVAGIEVFLGITTFLLDGNGCGLLVENTKSVVALITEMRWHSLL